MALIIALAQYARKGCNAWQTAIPKVHENRRLAKKKHIQGFQVVFGGTIIVRCYIKVPREENAL